VETKSSGCVMNGFCMNKTTKYSSQWESSSYAEVSFYLIILYILQVMHHSLAVFLSARVLPPAAPHNVTTALHPPPTRLTSKPKRSPKDHHLGLVLLCVALV
jgi:hypothetical protein